MSGEFIAGKLGHFYPPAKSDQRREAAPSTVRHLVSARDRRDLSRKQPDDRFSLLEEACVEELDVRAKVGNGR
jgi:hypothetical protein